jgi:cytochrome b
MTNFTKTVMVWDLPTRLFHWLLALLIASQYVTGIVGDEWLELHAYLGYSTLSLIIFRLFWGFFGSRWSRFNEFFSTQPNMSERNDLSSLDNSDHVHIGHTKLGSLSILAMLAFISLQIISGLMSNDDISFAGPYTKHVSNAVVDWMTWYHGEVGFYFIIILISLHVCAVFYYQLKSVDLIYPMLHGFKKLKAPILGGHSQDNLKLRLLALILLIISTLLVALVIGFA